MTYTAFPIVYNEESMLNGYTEFVVYADDEEHNIHMEFDIKADSESQAIEVAKSIITHD